MKSVGATIVPIKLQEGKKVDSKVLRHVTGSGTVYVRALKEIDEDVRCLEII